MELIGDNTPIARFGTTLFTTPGQHQTTTGSETVPSYSFTSDADTGMYRSVSNQLDFATGGIRRLNIDANGRLNTFSTGGDLLTMRTTNTNGLMQIDATTGTANINNLTWYLTSSGSAIMLLRNDAKTGYAQPFTITRNATGGTNSIYFKVGGDSSVTNSDIEAVRIIASSDGTQGKLLIGHSAQDVYLNNADATPTNNFQVYSYKTGATSPVSLLGTNGVNTALWASARTNSASRRVVNATIGGVSVSVTAGAEKGKLEFSTKAATDAGVVVRTTIDETGVAFAVPISGKLNVNTAITQTLFSGASDITADYPLMVSKSGGGATTTGVAIGSNNVDRSTIVFNQTNTDSTRLASSRIVGLNSSNTAGAEKGYIVVDTKSAADVSPVTRLTLSETAAAFTVPVTSSNLSYNTKVVAGVLTNDGIYSTAAGFTINTSDLATGKIFQVYNNSAASITITQGAGVTMRLVGTATTGNRTVAQRGLATITCISATEVVVEVAT